MSICAGSSPPRRGGDPPLWLDLGGRVDSAILGWERLTARVSPRLPFDGGFRGGGGLRVGGRWAVRSCPLPGVVYSSEDAAPVLRFSTGRDDSLLRRRQPTASKWVGLHSGLRERVKDFVVYNLEPLEIAVFKFLVSLPSDFPKRSKFTCRFIFDGSDAEVGKLLGREFLFASMLSLFLFLLSVPDLFRFCDDLLDVKMKRSKLDDLMAKMADPARMGPRPILPTGRLSATAGASTAAGTSTPVAAGSSRGEIFIQVPPAPAASEAKKAKKQPQKREQTTIVDLEDELKEDPSADLQRQRRRKKPKFDEAFEKALKDDAAWQHKVDPLRVLIIGGLLSLACQDFGLSPSIVGVETSLAAKIKAEKELSAALDQIEVLKGERDSALSFLPFKEKATTLEDKLSEKAEASGSRRGSSGGSDCFVEDLSEVTEMCQETLDICLDQISHLCHSVDFFAITLKSRWDPKGRRIFVPQESEVEGELPSAEEIVPERDPVVTAQSSQPEAGDAAGGSGECPT
ncbi:hypothetical protein PIB30_031177 [Stylosanthes scabra]|uniref:Uncharacterized protein n=1 Tax=Stylosanthes scabra TaxID=79078 RepID=A0ABU6QC46_9FABA|nr:hypothetical protein [Stylosanthes scabra]